MTETSTEPTTEPRTTSRRGLLITGGAVAATALGAAAAARATAPVTVPAPTAAGFDAPRFEGQAVLITGATSGIGEAAAHLFAREGADVWFCGRRADKGAAVQKAIRDAGGKATYVQADVRVEDQVKAFTDRMLAATGRIDAAFNNAGISVRTGFGEVTTAIWDDVYATNVRGVYLSLKYQLPAMTAARRGSIVVTSSVQGVGSRATSSAYSSSKHALIGLVQAIALEYGPMGIRCNAVLPGATDTPLARREAGADGLPDAVWQEGSRRWAATHVPAFQRFATAEEVAVVAVDLASTRYTFLTGASVPVDGGMSAALP